MKIEFHPAAARELMDSARYYENKLPGLGADFLDEVRRSLGLITKNPQIGFVVEAPYRRVVLARFPFAIVYRATEPGIRVISVSHGRRESRHWAGRK